MKKYISLLLILVLLLPCVKVFAEEPAPALSKDLVVLFTSDVHCGIDQGFGYAGLAAIRDELAKNNHVVLVDNGDAIQGEPIGTMTSGEAIIKLMNTVGYEVAIPGNHEFDYSMDRFLELTKLAQFPYISTNLTHKGEKVFAPYVMKEYDGVKIAFVGVTTPKTFTASTPAFFQDKDGSYVYGFCEDNSGEALYAAIQNAVDAARAEGASYVVLQAHLGIVTSCSPWTSTEVIEHTTGIDVLLDGHSHSELQQEEVKNKDGQKVLLAACGTKLADIGYLRISQDGTMSTGLYTWKHDVSFPNLMGSTNVSRAVDSALSALDTKLSQVVAETQVALTVNDPKTDVRIIRRAETNLGDLCADAYRTMADADIGFANGGGIRAGINAGKITLNDILRVHPFGNSLCKVEATGQQILDALEWSAHSIPDEMGGFLHASGLTYEIHTYVKSSVTCDEKGNFTGVAGEYRVKNVKVGEKPLDLNKTYTVAAMDYLLKNGGDGNSTFVDCPLLIDESMLDNQVLIQYISETLNGVIGEEYADPYGQGRIVAVEAKP